jgi:hypothetical protein
VLPRQRRAKSEQSAYLNCKELGDKVGKSAAAIHRQFVHYGSKDGVIKKTTAGRGRKPYTTMRIARKGAAIKKEYPDQEF